MLHKNFPNMKMENVFACVLCSFVQRKLSEKLLYAHLIGVCAVWYGSMQFLLFIRHEFFGLART